MKKLGYMAGTKDETFNDALRFLSTTSKDGIIRFHKTVEAALDSRPGFAPSQLVLVEVGQSETGFEFKRIQPFQN